MKTSKHEKQNSISSRLYAQRQRLLALQISLQDAQRQGYLTSQQYQARHDQVQKQLTYIKQLNNWNDHDSNLLQQSESLGLPDLDTCNSTQRQICYAYLKERAEFLSNNIKEAQYILDEANKTVSGRSSNFSINFSLARIRKKMLQLEKIHTQHYAENREYDQMLTSLFQQNGVFATKHENFNAIVQLHESIELKATQLIHLQQQLQQATEVNNSMRSWLEQESQNLNAPVPYTRPPNVEESRKLSDSIDSPAIDYLEQTSQRIDLAERFISSTLNAFIPHGSVHQSAYAAGDSENKLSSKVFGKILGKRLSP